MGLLGWFGGGATTITQTDAAADIERRERLKRRYAELMEEYADATYFQPKSYRDLSIGEAKSGRTPAVEYLSRNACMRVHSLMSREEMRRASLIRGLGMRYDDIAEGEVSEVIDLKPDDRPGMEYGAINLGPTTALVDASGTHWRLFLELASGGGRRGDVSRRFVIDCVL
jgi:hypothetical protein